MLKISQMLQGASSSPGAMNRRHACRSGPQHKTRTAIRRALAEDYLLLLSFRVALQLEGIASVPQGVGCR